ncbi:MAG: hypothetical protein AAGF87_07215 [Bacteroidota bacterium]
MSRLSADGDTLARCFAFASCDYSASRVIENWKAAVSFDAAAFDRINDENLIDHIVRIGVRFWVRGELSETPSVDTAS